MPRRSEELGEPTRGTQGSKGGTGDTEPREGNTAGTLSSGDVWTKLSWIARLARESPGRVFSSIHQVIDESWLAEAYALTRKDGARGVDGEGARAFGANLRERVRTLRDQLFSGQYRAPAVRRVHIPKGDGRKTRPIGIPTFEDKVLQRGVGMVLSAIYEEDFLPCSYGYRPGRSAHQALERLRDGLMEMGGGYVVELDIERFFDTLVHATLRGFLDRRVTDGVLRRAIDKWLAAGVLENGTVTYPEEGTPQGGVISPLLANIYLHEVLDRWFEEEVKPRMRGRSFMVRYADDAVLVFEDEEDARRVLAVLPKRFERFGLRLHPEKTGLVPFRRPPRQRGGTLGGGRGAGTFDLLGFTMYWTRSRRNYWVIKRRTASSRLARAVKRITDWCKRNRHEPIAAQHVTLCRKMRGHYAYFGLPGNYDSLTRFYWAARQVWWTWLRRRSNAARTLGIAWYLTLLSRCPLPWPKMLMRDARLRAANP